MPRPRPITNPRRVSFRVTSPLPFRESIVCCGYDRRRTSSLSSRQHPTPRTCSLGHRSCLGVAAAHAGAPVPNSRGRPTHNAGPATAGQSPPLPHCAAGVLPLHACDHVPLHHVSVPRTHLRRRGASSSRPRASGHAFSGCYAALPARPSGVCAASKRRPHRRQPATRTLSLS